MLPRLVSLSSIASLALIVLLIVPANAASSMSLGSSANYNVSVALKMSQSCNASPVTFNQTACGPAVPAYHIAIVDLSGVCTQSTNTSVSNCFFSPFSIAVLPGNGVVWTNNGQVIHAVATCDSSNFPTNQTCPIMDSPGLDSFSSGPISPGGTFSHSFTAPGFYYYFDPIHPWMHGSVFVSLNAPPPQPVGVQTMPPPINVAGSVGWTVVGLDRNTAVLNVSHALGLMVDNIPIAPVAESGSFQQSIDLSTRVESPGTAAQLVSHLALPLMALLTGTTFSRPLPVNPIISSSLVGSSSSMPKMVTVWWVNGPLSKGSPVRVLTGFASVQGDETVNLPGIGSRSAWIVSSSVQESVTSMIPQFGSLMNMTLGGQLTTNNANARLVLRFDYDKSGDLLLASSDSAVVTATMMDVLQPGQLLCGQFGDCVTVSTMTTVTRVMTMTVSASLTLSSTSLNLGRRLSVSSQSSGLTSMLQDAMSQPVLYALAGITAAAIASTVVWITRRRSPTRAPQTLQAPPQQGTRTQ